MPRLKTWTQKDKEAFDAGAKSSGSLLPARAPAPLEPTADAETLEYQALDGKVAAAQKANLADKSPGMVERLSKMAAARRKFYGQ